MTATHVVPDEMLTVRAVAEETGIPENTLLWWRHVGRGPRTFKVGRRVYIRRSDLDAFLAEAYATTSAGGTR